MRFQKRLDGIYCVFPGRSHKAAAAIAIEQAVELISLIYTGPLDPSLTSVDLIKLEEGFGQLIALCENVIDSIIHDS